MTATSTNEAEQLTCQVTVMDETALTFISCPDNPSLVADVNCMAMLPNDYKATAIDNCDGSWIVPHGMTAPLDGYRMHNITFSTNDTSTNKAKQLTALPGDHCG
jgi:hypothetical protein